MTNILEAIDEAIIIDVGGKPALEFDINGTKAYLLLVFIPEAIKMLDRLNIHSNTKYTIIK